MARAGVVSAFLTVAAALTVLAAAAPAQADATGTVTGQVVDTSGAPLAGICVYPDTVPYPGTGYSGSQTDASGDYTLSLPPGTYLISFEACVGNYAPQFYPGQPSWATAGKVTVTAGQTTAGIGARMVVGGTITGKVLDQTTGAPPPQYDIQPVAEPLGPPSFPDNPEPVAYATLGTDGTYTLTRLAPGTYVVEFRSEGVNGLSTPYADTWYPDVPDPGHATVVSVQSGQTVALGVQLEEAPGTVTGEVTDLAGTPLAGYLVRASIAQPDGSAFPVFGFTSTGADGRFTLSDLAPGTWTIGVQLNGTGYVIRSESVAVQAGATTPNVDFAFCITNECPPTHLLTWSTRIQDHELFFSGTTSDPASGLFTVLLRGHIGRRRVTIRLVGDDVAKGGQFSDALTLPRRDRALRSGTLTLNFAPDQAAFGGRFVLRVPSFFAGKPATPSRVHKHKRKRRKRPRTPTSAALESGP